MAPSEIGQPYGPERRRPAFERNEGRMGRTGRMGRMAGGQGGGGVGTTEPNAETLKG